MDRTEWLNNSNYYYHDYHHIPDVSTTKSNGIFFRSGKQICCLCSVISTFLWDPVKTSLHSGLTLHSSMLPASGSSCPKTLTISSLCFLGPLWNQQPPHIIYCHFPPPIHCCSAFEAVAPASLVSWHPWTYFSGLFVTLHQLLACPADPKASFF